MRKRKNPYEITKGIMVDRKIRFGKPVIKGTRIPVDVVLGKLAGGMDFEGVMKEYEITKQDIFNALNYAAYLVGKEEIHIVPWGFRIC